MEGCYYDNLVLWLDYGKYCRILKRFLIFLVWKSFYLVCLFYKIYIFREIFNFVENLIK